MARRIPSRIGTQTVSHRISEAGSGSGSDAWNGPRMSASWGVIPSLLAKAASAGEPRLDDPSPSIYQPLWILRGQTLRSPWSQPDDKLGFQGPKSNQWSGEGTYGPGKWNGWRPVRIAEQAAVVGIAFENNECRPMVAGKEISGQFAEVERTGVESVCRDHQTAFVDVRL